MYNAEHEHEIMITYILAPSQHVTFGKAKQIPSKNTRQ